MNMIYNTIINYSNIGLNLLPIEENQQQMKQTICNKDKRAKKLKPEQIQIIDLYNFKKTYYRIDWEISQ